MNVDFHLLAAGAAVSLLTILLILFLGTSGWIISRAIYKGEHHLHTLGQKFIADCLQEKSEFECVHLWNERIKYYAP